MSMTNQLTNASASKKPTPMDKINNPCMDKGIQIKKEPINWSARSKCEKMDNAELESLIREASRVLSERKNARAQKLIDKVCVALNELKEMGNIEMRFDCSYDAYVHDILDEVDHFRPEMFVVRGN